MRAKLKKRTLWLGGSAAMVVTAALVVPLTAAEADPVTVIAKAETFGDLDDDWRGRYQTFPISTPDGHYNVATNLWNPAVTGEFEFQYDPTATTFTVSKFKANSYFGSGADPTDPECADDGLSSDPLDPNCDWVGVGDPWINPDTGNRDPFAYRKNAYPYPAWYYDQPPSVGQPHDVERYSQFGMQIHAPAAYPSIIAGCHWGTCSGVDPKRPGAPFPLQGTSISRLESVWTIQVPQDPSPDEAWNASYDIWYDTNTRWTSTADHTPPLPHNPQAVNNPGQNDGAEIMIWVNHAGYNLADPGDTMETYEPGIIQPAGVLLQADVALEGVQTLVDGVPRPVTFDVWGARPRSFDNGIRWNVISFVAREKGQGLITPGATWGGFDAQIFARYAASLDEQGKFCATADPVGIVRQTIATPDGKIHWYTTPEERPCLELTWWMTSIQAGFEIWNLPEEKSLTTTRFMVAPVAVSGGVNTGGRATASGVPLVNWNDTFNLEASGCPNGRASWSIDAQNYAPWTQPDFTPVGGHKAIGNPEGFVPDPNPANVKKVEIVSVPMVETPAGSGNYIAAGIGPLLNNPDYILHGPATVTVEIRCQDEQTYTTQSTLYIDPSGRVMDTNGDPVPGATVTLYRSDTQNGVFTPVSNGSAIMSPANRTNPDLTDANGHYRWDVQPGWYKVRAQKEGCTRPGSSQPYVESPAKQVATDLPPVTDLNLVLYCGEELRSPFHVEVRRTTSWPSDSGGGYCAEIIVTNLAGNPLEWVVEVTMPGSIYTKWNFESTHLGGDRYRIRGVAWNQILAPGASTHSVGYCANNT